MPKPTDPTAARLVTAFGCMACKHQQIDDDFLTQHSRFWCSKRKQSFGGEDRAHEQCPTWTFNGNDELIDQLSQPRLPGGEA